MAEDPGSFQPEGFMRQAADRTEQKAAKAALTLLTVLLAADVVFILLHVVYVETIWLRGLPFSLEADGGFPESFQYLKQACIVLCMAATAWYTRRKHLVAWAGFFAFLLYDDAAKLHERAGLWLAQRLSLPEAYSLRPEDFGEILVALALGAIVCALALASLMDRSEKPCRVSLHVFVLLVLLGFTGVVLDALHVIAYQRGSLLAQFLLIAEDGGEMLVMSMLTAYAFHLAAGRGQVHSALNTMFARLQMYRRNLRTHAT